MTAPKGKTYRKAFITVHVCGRYRNSFTFKDMTLGEAKKRLFGQEQGEPALVAVDAIRSVQAVKDKVSGTHYATTRRGSTVSTLLEGPEVHRAWISTIGNSPLHVTESVEEIRALITEALAEAEVA